MPREWSLGVEATFCWIKVISWEANLSKGLHKVLSASQNPWTSTLPSMRVQREIRRGKRKKKSKIRLENRHIYSAYLRDYKKANHNCVTVVHNPLSKVTYYLNKSGDPRVDMHTRTAAKPGGLGIASLLYSTLILKVQNSGRQTDRRSSHRKKKKKSNLRKASK